jgi:epoxyqueuosine reductase
MPPRSKPVLREVIEKALSLGASAAGVVPVSALRGLPHRGGRILSERSPRAACIVVLALAHPAAEPSLDWWDNRPGRTPGNRRLTRIAKELAGWLRRSGGVASRNLPYGIGAGGTYLKDAAVLAGLGVIGKNNLLVTPDLGPRVRLKALEVDLSLSPTAPVQGFDPCRTCDAPCRRACPRNAFGGGAYERQRCRLQMGADADNPYRIMDVSSMTYSIDCIKFCRACELACPVGETGRG